MPIISGKQFFGGKPGQVVQDAFNTTPLQQKVQQPGYFSRVGSNLKNIGLGLGQDIQKQAVVGAEAQVQGNYGKEAIALGRGGLRTAGAAAQAVFAPVMEAPGIKQATEAIGGALAKTVPMQKFQEWSQRHPEAAKDINNVLDIGALFGGKEISAPIGKGLSTTAEATAGAVKPTLEATGKVLKKAGEGAYGITITPEEGTRMAVQAYQAKQGSLVNRVKNMIKDGTGAPITEANTAARKGLQGTEWRIGVQAKQIADELWNKNIAPKLDAVKGQVDTSEFFNLVKKQISKETTGVKKNQMLEAFNAFSEPYKNVGKIGLRKLQEYKESWAEFLPESSYAGKPISAALKRVQDIAAEQARKVIYKYGGKDIQQAYLDYGNLKSIMKAGIKSVGDPAKKSISKNVWQFIMDKTITPIATTGGKILYRTGEGLEFVGKKGAKKVKDVID